MPKKLTIKQFIEKAKLIHENKYNYSSSYYINSKIPLKIKCPIHGYFLQSPDSHLKGSQCQKCSKVYVPTTEEFIIKAKKLHGNIYDYSKTNYIDNKTKIIIICLKHGIFDQLPKTHLKTRGCLKCKNENSHLTTKEFIEKSKKIHKNKYDYSKVNYIKNNIKVQIICKIHGSFFQIPNAHLNKQGCPRCSHVISKPEIEFLNYLNISDTKKYRQKRIGNFTVDGLKDKTVYEFLGDYWHGNPKIYISDRINKTNRKTFGELYNKTLIKFNKLKSLGYNIKYIWESDYKEWIKNKNYSIPLLEY